MTGGNEITWCMIIIYNMQYTCVLHVVEKRHGGLRAVHVWSKNQCKSGDSTNIQLSYEIK